MNNATAVHERWNRCNVLHDESMSYGNHIEQSNEI